jgi:hypothetical protein
MKYLTNTGTEKKYGRWQGDRPRPAPNSTPTPLSTPAGQPSPEERTRFAVDTIKRAVPRRDEGEQDSRQRAAGARAVEIVIWPRALRHIHMYTASSQKPKDGDHEGKKVSQRTQVL